MKGNGTEERLAARYWDLLDFYPERYRDERGPELVGTLLDCARPGQTRPSWREARALVLEGLRLRAGTGGHRPARATVARGMQVGVLLVLVLMLHEGVADLTIRRGFDDARPVTVGWWVLVGLAVLAVVVPFVLLAVGRVRLALPFVVVAGAVHMVGYPWLLRAGYPRSELPLPDEWPVLLPLYLHPGFAVAAVLAAAAVAWLRPPAAGVPAVMAVVLAPAIVSAPEWLQGTGLLPTGFTADVPVALWLFGLMYLGAVGYAVVDARPAVALAVLLSAIDVEMVAAWLKYGFNTSWPALELTLLPPVGVAVWLGARRQARLPGRDLTA